MRGAKQLSNIYNNKVNYFELTKKLTAAFKAAANSGYGLVIVDTEDDSIVFINNDLLRYFDLQWSELLLEPIYSLLHISQNQDYKQIVANYLRNDNQISKFIFKDNKEHTIQLISKDTKVVVKLKLYILTLDEKEYKLIYGMTESPVSSLLDKPETISPLDPWINSFTRLMFIVTDNYVKFWMFVLGVVCCLAIAQVTVHIGKSFTQLKSIDKVNTTPQPSIVPKNPI